MGHFNALVLIRGAGDLGSGVAYRLVKSGFPVVMTELPAPLLARTTVSYGNAVSYNTALVEGIEARKVTAADALPLLANGIIPIIVDPGKDTIRVLNPAVVVDARVAKINIDTTLDDAPLVIALGPGFTVGIDCHAVIETNRGHDLGRVLWHGSAQPNTGIPGNIGGKETDRILRAPAEGTIWQIVNIGEYVKTGELLARVGDLPVYAPFDGVLRGMIDSDVRVKPGMKIGDVDPRARRENCFTISDKSLAIGGGVLEAILSAPQMEERLASARPGMAERSC
jgi:xanthine dehydrogenase accessory factor